MKIEKEDGYQVCKPTCVKERNKVRNCPTRDGKQVAPNLPKDYASKKRSLYALETKEVKPDKGDDDDSKFLYLFFSVMSSL